nr:MAG TPA: hypothetical protein [Caudoviricetes sp.]
MEFLVRDVSRTFFCFTFNINFKKRSVTRFIFALWAYNVFYIEMPTNVFLWL